MKKFYTIQRLKDDYSFFLHVDGAIGGFARAVQEIRDQTDGIEHSDSTTLNPAQIRLCPIPLRS